MPRLEIRAVCEVRLKDGSSRYFAYARRPATSKLVLVPLREDEAKALGVDVVLSEEDLTEEEKKAVGLKGLTEEELKEKLIEVIEEAWAKGELYLSVSDFVEELEKKGVVLEDKVVIGGRPTSPTVCKLLYQLGNEGWVVFSERLKKYRVSYPKRKKEVDRRE